MPSSDFCWHQACTWHTTYRQANALTHKNKSKPKPPADILMMELGRWPLVLPVGFSSQCGHID